MRVRVSWHVSFLARTFQCRSSVGTTRQGILVGVKLQNVLGFYFICRVSPSSSWLFGHAWVFEMHKDGRDRRSMVDRGKPRGYYEGVPLLIIRPETCRGKLQNHRG